MVACGPADDGEGCSGDSEEDLSERDRFIGIFELDNDEGSRGARGVARNLLVADPPENLPGDGSTEREDVVGA